jgi:hypothetical protein
VHELLFPLFFGDLKSLICKAFMQLWGQIWQWWVWQISSIFPLDYQYTLGVFFSRRSSL